MRPYFFVPGTKLQKISTIKELGVEIIIDIEDAVKASDRSRIILELLSNPSHYLEYYVRLPLYDENAIIDISLLESFILQGYKKFIFPKLEKGIDFNEIISKFNNVELELILLVETPRFFLELQDILLEHRSLIKAVSLGSHDFMNEVGGLHSLKNLEYARVKILYLARMINAEAIDIASMELKDGEGLKQEIKDGFLKGYDAKFYIHPWQINIYRSLLLYSKDDLAWALKIIEQFNKVSESQEFSPVIIDGQIVERPHLNKAKKIIEYYEMLQDL